MNIDNKGIIDIESCPRRQPPSQEEIYYRNATRIRVLSIYPHNFYGLSQKCRSNVERFLFSIKRVCLNGQNLKKRDLQGQDLRAAYLRGANLRGADLRGADWTGVNLTGANLTHATVIVTLRNWNRFLAVKPSPKQFDGANANLQLELPDRWNKDMLDHHLHHLNNTESGSLLTFIDSLGNDHQKSHLALQLMESLQGNNVSSVALPLMSVLGKPPYCDLDILITWLDPICAVFLHTITPPSCRR